MQLDDLGCTKQFKIEEYSGSNRLEISIFNNDKTFKKGSKTKPGSELSFKAIVIEPKVDYVVI